MKVIQHQHERHRGRPERRSEARGGAAQHRQAQTAHVGDQVGVARRDPGERRRQQGEHDRGIIVEAVQSHPRDATILTGRPLDEQGRLAVPGGRGNAHHAAPAGAGRPDQPGAAHRTRVRVRDRQSGVEQEFIQLDDRPLRRYRVVFRHRGLLACRYGSTSARCGHVNRGTPRVSRPHPTQVSSSCGRAGSRRAISPSARLSARTGSTAPAPITRSCRGDQVGGHSPRFQAELGRRQTRPTGLGLPPPLCTDRPPPRPPARSARPATTPTRASRRQALQPRPPDDHQHVVRPVPVSRQLVGGVPSASVAARARTRPSRSARRSTAILPDHARATSRPSELIRVRRKHLRTDAPGVTWIG